MKTCSLLLAALIATLPAVAAAQEPPKSATLVEKEKGAATIAEAVELQGVVTAIDKNTRELTIKGGSGKDVTFTAGPQIKNFKQIKVGDLVTLNYIAALGLELKKGGGRLRERIESEQTVAAKPGEKPAAGKSRTVKVLADVTAVDFDTRRDCAESNRLDRIARADGVFFTGGNQLRITTLIGGTPVAKLIRERNAHGMHVAGTSAGAAVLSEHMIAFGEEGGSPRAGSVGLSPGLGLTNRFIIDQHFRQRDRLGRLTTALAFNPFAVGIGLDEDTAAFIGGTASTGTLAAVETGSDAARFGPADPYGTLESVELDSDTATLAGTLPISGTVAAVETGSDLAEIIDSFSSEIWSYTLPNGMAAADCAASMVNMMTELHLLKGLDPAEPLSETDTQRSAGSILLQLIAGLPTTVTRQ